VLSKKRFCVERAGALLCPRLAGQHTLGHKAATFQTLAYRHIPPPGAHGTVVPTKALLVEICPARDSSPKLWPLRCH
jgi:hypothetical protein